MSAIVAYIFYFIAATVSPLQRRFLAKKRDLDGSGQIAFSFQVALVTIVLSLLLLIKEPFVIKGNIAYIILLALACGVFGSLSYILNYKCQKHIQAGVSSVISNVYTPVTIILATLFLSEKLTNLQIVGTVILFIGMFIVSKKHSIGRFKFDKYFWMMILSGVFLGILITAERYLQKTTGFTTGTLISWWSTCLFLGLTVLVRKEKSHYTRKEIITTGVLRFLQNLSWVILVFVVGNLSVVSAITTFKIVIVFLGGYLFLNERDHLVRKIIGSLVAIAGLLLMM